MSIKKNFLYNMLFTVFNLAAPLITMPYISRILGSNNLGIVSFSNSLVQYFMFLAALGTGLYGSREIAYVKSNNQELKKTFYEIFYIKLLMTLVSIIGYIFFIMIQVKDLRVFLILQGINLLGVLFDISWFFQGIEKFKLLSIRNIIVKFITIVLIYIFLYPPELLQN